ncbi:hypothetical protein GOP47_0026182 [Adiantum capillus-veneris]|uniref:Pentatricopeptide repeat-containing protein n=1 Tax=Adiantum capillus-veneris TaxID=13818 RepID=A0A9D4U1U9_ADICA|nr:hypothetical protein GOP47_0026182 [Adiantum capillus-veneris]
MKSAMNHKVIDQIARSNKCSWNSLVVGHIRQGKYQQALMMYQELQEASLQPNEYAFAALLRACSELMNFQTGFKIHSHIVQIGLLESNLFVGNTLIDMYMKLGWLREARSVFDALSVRDVVSWNVLLSGYVKHDCVEEVLSMFELMQLKEVSPNVVTFLCAMKACGLAGTLNKGCEIHATVARQRLLEREVAVGNALVDMYIKCGSLGLAQEVFNKLVVRDVISWNALMVGHIKFEYAREALHSFERMQLEGVCPDSVTLVCGLKASGLVSATYEGAKMHLRISTEGLLERDLVVANALLDMYATCGYFKQAKQMFNKHLVRGVISWTSLIAGYAKHNHSVDALFCFEQMQHEGIFPNAATLVCALKACGSVGAIEKGQEIHARASILQLLEGNSYIGNSLVDMYAKCGMLGKAQDVFDSLLVKDTASWNVLIAGYAQNEFGKEALACLERMQFERVSPDAVTLVCSLKACTSTENIAEGENLEFEIYRKGLLHDIIVANALINFHTKCGSYSKAQELFDRLPKQDVASWTTIMGSYVKQYQGEDALHCFEQMQVKGVCPDAHSFVFSLKSCGALGALDKGKELHTEIEKMGLLENNVFVCSALVDMYFKCGWAAGAQKLFDRLPIRDCVMWTALLAGYADHAHCIEALSSFEQMDVEGASADVIAFARGLKACETIGAIGKGIDIHVEIAERGLLERAELLLGNALVSMYAKWGLLRHAEEVFHTLSVRDVNSWNALMSGYAQQGDIENVFRILRGMGAEGERPNIITFIGVLNACGHAGFVDTGKSIFEETLKEHGIVPSLKLHMCMIDLLNRAGYIDVSAAMIRNIPSHSNFAVWQSVLNACLKFSHVGLGKLAFLHALQNGQLGGDPAYQVL